MKFYSVTVVPPFSEVNEDWESLCVKWRFRCIENFSKL